jgi:protein-S-isoprenylcysteine O-methyltransferase Ste14
VRSLLATLRLFVVGALMAATVFLPAGRLDLRWAWATVAVCSATTALMAGTMAPDLLEERRRPAPGGEDRRFRLKVLPLILALWLVAGFDLRFGWSRVPAWAHAAGLALVVGGLGLAWWALRVNRFFSPVIRLQTERGHHVIDRGPYARIRHPGYAGSLLAAAATAPALGSWWALVPAAAYGVAFARRAAREDRFLHRELPGYEAYAQRVRHRLVWGLW